MRNLNDPFRKNPNIHEQLFGYRNINYTHHYRIQWSKHERETVYFFFGISRTSSTNLKRPGNAETSHFRNARYIYTPTLSQKFIIIMLGMLTKHTWLSMPITPIDTTPHLPVSYAYAL